jgi:hypothetical protein
LFQYGFYALEVSKLYFYIFRVENISLNGLNPTVSS